jgi:ATP-dependent DNA helicase RecQ
MLTPESALKKYFGYDKFRPNQREIIQRVLDKKDCIVLMPTGGGKSVCYQIPALLMEGVCIVVSPLIALMKDQVEGLKRNQIAANYINSSQTSQESTEIENQLRQNKLKLLYVSPEKLLTDSFQRLLESIQISFFAIDEAHCISSWGHDFRPEYTQLKVLKKKFPSLSVIALTATADQLTRQDICKQLELVDPQIFIASFNRPNIRLYVTAGVGRMKKILQYLDTRPNRAGIVYCLSRKTTESVAENLQKAGYKASAYHAGLEAQTRNKVQEAFLKDDIQIICATIAFGMGIDKPNVRFVIHYNLPRNVESYYQEIGRAGRDGLPSDAILFYSYQDVISWRDMLTKDPQTEDHLNLKLKKLERVQHFAEAQNCRRKILLSYFHEELADDCGNCDVCLNPPQTFDGTLFAQKALSANIRLKQEKNESTGMNLLIDVLRGSQNRIIQEKGLDSIKTYGAGKDTSFSDWREYLLQMLNLGVFELAYDENYALKPGMLANRILNNQLKIALVRPEVLQTKIEERYEKPKTKTELVQEELFEALRIFRKEIADNQGLAPYQIFDDNTLNEMSVKRPTSMRELRQIAGVSEAKAKTYGAMFLDEIVHQTYEQYRKGNQNLKGFSLIVTYHLYRQGITIPADIVQARADYEGKALSIGTIQSHLAELYEKGYPIDIEQYITEKHLNFLLKHLAANPEAKPKEIFDLYEERFNYLEIKIAIAVFRRGKI